MSMSSLEWAWNQELSVPYYVVDGRYYYSARTLDRDRWATGRDFGLDRKSVISEMRPTSRPVYVRFDDFDSTILTTDPNGRLIRLAGPSRSNQLRYITRVSEMKFPIGDQFRPGQEQLPELPLPPFDQEVLDELNRLKVEEATLEDSSLIQARLNLLPEEEGPDVRAETQSGPDDRFGESIRALISRLYGLPLPDLPMISFEQAGQFIRSGEILSYQIDPLLQPWVGPPGTANRIVTLIGRDGTNYLVLAKYLPELGQIVPPVR